MLNKFKITVNQPEEDLIVTKSKQQHKSQTDKIKHAWILIKN